MRVHSLCLTALWGVLFVSLLGLCSADDKTLFEVVGAAECADCKEYNIKTTQAFSGLSVSVDCKLEHGETKRMGDITKLDKDGKFKISVSQQLHQDCYVQLHSAAAVPCAAHNGVESTKIVLKSQTNGIQIFGPSQNLQFSTAMCASEFWHFFKHPPFPYTHPWKKKFPRPPVPVYKPPVPVYKPPVPVYKPKPPVHKPPVPIYKPKPPVHKPPVPVYKPKPPVPVHKPKPPVYKPPVPVYKPPVPVHQPKPPVYKKPCPPVIPKLPPLPKIKFPPKHFHHPKFGHYPPLPPYHP